MRIAVIGSGLSACIAANRLAVIPSNYVDIFEAGRGVGGRLATRRVALDKERVVHFDHGCPAFQASLESSAWNQLLSQCIQNRIVKPWSSTERIGRIDVCANVAKFDSTSNKQNLLVGTPSMNSVCKHWLQHYRIGFHAAMKVSASYARREWAIHCAHKEIGRYDWLICSNRSSVTEILSNVDTPSSIRASSSITSMRSVPVLVVMAVLPRSLSTNRLPFDAASVNGHSSLRWIARESSKPQRNVEDDDVDTWIIHSSITKATELLQARPIQSGNREPLLNDARDVLLDSFQEVLSMFAIKSFTGNNAILFSQAHLWSSAFPDNTGKTHTATTDHCFVDPESCFAACGDYLHPDSSSLSQHNFSEAAATSGMAVAQAIINENKKYNN